jgi:tetratricopeptide (TPR) repeat protein
MKKPLIVLALLSAGIFSAHAQSNKVVSAKMHLDEFIKDADTSALKDAKEAIDLAAANDKTKDDPKMYLYRGDVYRALWENQISTITTKTLKASGSKVDKDGMMKATAMAYIVADTNNLSVAVHSFMMVIQLIPKDFYAEEAKQGLQACATYIQNKATADYGTGKLAEALVFFERIITIAKFQGVADTAMYYKESLQNVALVARKANNYNVSITYNKELIRLKVGGPQPYNEIITDYDSLKDQANAAATLQQARAAFPDDVNLMISELNIYLAKGDNDKAISTIQSAIDKLSSKTDDGSKKILCQLYFVLGNAYNKLANPKDANNAVLPKPANYEELFGKAEDSYNKSLAINPTYFDALYDLGALYNNRSAAYNQAANDVPPSQTKKYNDLVAQATEYSKKAQPFLERAHAVKPDDQDTKAALLKIYANTGQTDKIKDLQGVK